MMYLKLHKSYRNVLALCDENLIGKKFEQGQFQLDIREKFYKGELLDKEKAIRILKQQALNDATFNISGQESIECAKESGLIQNDDGIKRIQDIPFTLILL